MYGESFGGNLAEERWSKGGKGTSIDIVSLFDTISDYDLGARNCYRDDNKMKGYALLEQGM